MKLSPRLQSFVDECWTAETRLSLEDLVASEVARAEGPMDELTAQARTNRRYCNLTDDQHRVVRFVSESTFDFPAAIRQGICRRLELNSPQELALRLSLSARTAWISTQLFKNQPADELWRPLLLAKASRDGQAADKLVSLSLASKGRPNNKAYAVLCNGLTALHNQDVSLLQDAVAQTRNAKSYVSSVNQILTAALNKAPDQFASGMSQMLKQYRQYMFGDTTDPLTFIDAFALGIFELVREFDPTVVSTFEPTHRLPWDAEYQTWGRNAGGRVSEVLECMTVPEWLRRSLIDMEPVQWASVIRDNW